jgi:hypothetical protein
VAVPVSADCRVLLPTVLALNPAEVAAVGCPAGLPACPAASWDCCASDGPPSAAVLLLLWVVPGRYSPGVRHPGFCEVPAPLLESAAFLRGLQVKYFLGGCCDHKERRVTKWPCILSPFPACRLSAYCCTGSDTHTMHMASPRHPLLTSGMTADMVVVQVA